MPTTAKSADSASPFSGVTVARVVRPHGIRGELGCAILTDFPDRLTRLREIWLAAPNAPTRRVNVLRCRLTGGNPPHALFLLDGISTRTEAELYRGCELQIPLADRASLPPGQHYISDIIGCEVFELPAESPAALPSPPERVALVGAQHAVPEITSPAARESPAAEPLGIVRDLQTTSGQPLLVVDTPRGELLIPFVEPICIRIDPPARRIDVRLPPGLLDLNP